MPGLGFIRLRWYVKPALDILRQMVINALSDLHEAISVGRTLTIVGAGMSWEVSENKLALWSGLLENGLRRCIETDPRLRGDWQDTVRAHLDAGRMLLAADLIVAGLGGQHSGEFTSWLRVTMKSITPTSPGAIRALYELDTPIATTNYDSLLERITGFEPLTWSATAAQLRDWACGSGHILHLHGYWSDPGSIVMTTASYERVRDCAPLQQALRSLAFRHSFLLIGFGGGVLDPHFSYLRKWIRDQYGGSGYSHYRLVRETEYSDALTLHRESADNIRLVTYSENLGVGIRGICANNSGLDFERPAVIRPANDADIHHIYELDKNVFDEDDLINPDVFRMWQLTMSREGGTVFWVSECNFQPGAIDGYYGLLFLKASTLERFKAGEIREDLFTESDLCRLETIHEQREVLIFSVVSTAPPRSAGPRQLVRHLAENLYGQSTSGSLEFAYTCAATDAGKKTLTHLVDEGIATIWQAAAENRADKHPLYRLQINSDAFAAWNQAISRAR